MPAGSTTMEAEAIQGIQGIPETPVIGVGDK